MEEVKKLRLKAVTAKVKELTELVAQLDKLMIRVISLVGWIIILIKMFT